MRSSLWPSEQRQISYLIQLSCLMLGKAIQAWCLTVLTLGVKYSLCFQVEAIRGGIWSETSCSRVSYQQEVKKLLFFTCNVLFFNWCGLSIIFLIKVFFYNCIRLHRFKSHLSPAGFHADGFIWYISLNSNLKPLWSVCLARLRLLCIAVSWCDSAWLKGAAESTVEKLDHRISMLTGLNVKHPYGEYLQVVNYGIGGHYEPHFDHATVSWPCKLIGWFSWLKCADSNTSFFPPYVQSLSSPVYKLKTGNRIATFMIYVSLGVTIARPLVTEIVARFLFLFFPKP